MSAEGQTAAAETFDREPLGTEFSSTSNTREGLRFGEQVHGDCGPGTDRKTWTRRDLRSRGVNVVQPDAQQHTGAEPREGTTNTRTFRCMEPGGHRILALGGNDGQKSPRRPRTSLPGLSRRKRGQRLHRKLLTAGQPSCLNPGPKDAVQRAHLGPARHSGSRSLCGGWGGK